MKIKFVGGVERVTGSCTWCKTENIEFLVDCGMIQGEIHDNFENKKEFPFNTKNLKFVILTHAHLDHCGLIPRLYKEGFTGKVICTKVTAKLTKEILYDSVKICSFYEKEDIDKMQYSYFEDRKKFKWGILSPIDNDLFATVYRSSHILGSVSVGILSGKDGSGKGIYFSGDIGNNSEANIYQFLLKHRHTPGKYFKYVVCESTYGGKIRDDSEKSFENRINKLEEVILKTTEKGGTLLIPAFSLHRTQEILFDLYYLLLIKWKGEFFGNELSVKEILEKEYFFRDGFYFINIKKFQSIIEFLEIPEHFKTYIKSVYKLVYVFTLKAGSSNIFDKYPYIKNISIEFTKSGLKQYLIYEEDINDEIINKLEYNNINITKYYKFNKDNFNDLMQSELEKFYIKTKAINIVCDSPLSSRISEIYSEHIFDKYYNNSEDKGKYLYFNDNVKDWFNCDENTIIQRIKSLFTKEYLEIGVHSIKFINNNKYQKNLLTDIKNSENIFSENNENISIILTSSGMCDNGPILSYLDEYIYDEKNTILFAGFTASGTNGDILKNFRNMPEKEQLLKTIKISKSKIIPCSDIKIETCNLDGYSGHADQTSLLEYLIIDENEYKYTYPVIFLNHGDNKSREELKIKILERAKEKELKYEGLYPYNTEVIIPMKNNGWYDLDLEKWEEESETVDINKLVVNLNNLIKENILFDFDKNNLIGEENIQNVDNLTESINSLTKAVQELTNAVNDLNKK